MLHKLTGEFMIYGIGIDIIGIKRIKKIIRKHGEKFLNRIFTDNEIKESQKHRDPILYLGGRWAVKEAFSKSIGTGIGAKCSWKDVEILSTSSGAPCCYSKGNAKTIIDDSGVSRIIISISHERKHACAVVILEKE